MNILSRLFPSKPVALLCPHCEREMAEGHDVDACARKRMSRRFFFGVMGGAAVAAAVAPEMGAGWEAWVDGGHTLYRPSYLSIEMITAEMLRVLHNNPLQGKRINRNVDLRNLDRIFADAQSKIGDTLTIRKPRDFVGQEGLICLS
jgi:hypothetical protein